MNDGHNYSTINLAVYKEFYIKWSTHKNRSETKCRENEEYSYKCWNKN